MPTLSNEEELKQLKVDAILSPNKPLTRLAIYKWLDKHDISIHSDEVVKLDNLIQAIFATQNTALLKEVADTVIGADETHPRSVHVSHYEHTAHCIPEIKIWTRDALRAEQRSKLAAMGGQ